MLFTVMLPAVLIPLVALGIDATMCYIVQAKLSAAVDGAALGAGRLIGTTADPEEIAKEFIAANFRADNTAGFWRAYDLQPVATYTGGAAKVIDISATAKVPLLFARVFGQAFATVAANAQATRRDARLVFVLDRSGSMYRSGAYIPAKADAISFTHLFTPTVDELGFIAFDGTATVGYPSTGYPPAIPSPAPPSPPAFPANWDHYIKSTSVGGPDKNFLDGTANDMEHQINATANFTGGSTNTSEALWLAYAELQKAHLKAIATSPTHVDEKTNAIVLLTDGVPQSISIWPNNPADNAVAVLKTSSLCANKIVAGTNPTPTPMLGWISYPASAGTPQNPPAGLYRLASEDPLHTQSQWLNYWGTGTAQTPTPSPNTITGCAGMPAGLSDFNRIPSIDMYGNDMTGNAYQNSQFVDGSGTPVTPNPMYTGTALNRANTTASYDWALATWNGTDSAAKRIRTDVNKPNRVGDLTDMKIAIYVIGYRGDDNIDQGLLMRIANVAGSTSFVPPPNEQTGFYVLASDTESMAVAFQKVASAILRLSK